MPTDDSALDAHRHLKTLLYSAVPAIQRGLVRSTLSHISQQGVAPASLETPITRLINHGVTGKEFLGSVNEIINHPHGELAHAISDNKPEAIDTALRALTQESQSYTSQPYKTVTPLSERAQTLNAIAAKAMKDVPKAHRAAINGPIRSLVGVLDNKEVTLAKRDNRDPASPEVSTHTLGDSIRKALTAPDPKLALSSEISEVRTMTREIRNGIAMQLAANTPAPELDL
jgi:hypothetical protein